MALSTEDYEVYAVPSHPSADNQTNATLSGYLTHQRLEDANDIISAESSILKFMTTSKPALAITDDRVETASNKAQTNKKPVYGPKTRDQVYFDADKNSGFELWDDSSSQQKSAYQP